MSPAVFTVSDLCDGAAQAQAGTSYTLGSREVQVAMVEIHIPERRLAIVGSRGRRLPPDGVDGLLAARCDLPAK